MKVKNQPPITSEADAKEKLIVYVYEYLNHAGAKRAAQTFREEIGYNKDIQFNPEGPGFLANWWFVFWDLYCAAPDKRSQIEASGDARAFHEFNSGMRPIMSPSCSQPSPPQQGIPGMGVGGGMMPGARYGPHSGQLRGGPMGMGPRPMQNIGQVGPAPPMGFMPASSPRYAQHPSGLPPPPPQQHMNQGPIFAPGPGPGPAQDQLGPSPGMNRMTPVGGPPPPPGGPPPSQVVSMPGPGQVNQMQGASPPRNGSQSGWQSNVNYNVSSPANQPMYPGPSSNQPPNQGGTMMMGDGSMMDVKNSPVNGGAELPASHHDEYVMPVPFGQETNDHCESAEIMKLKQSMQDETKMFDKDQSEFGLGEYSDPQNKWA